MADMDGFGNFSVTAIDPATSRKAALLACSRAKDVAEATVLLRMLGIIENPDALPTHIVGITNYRRAKKK